MSKNVKKNFNSSRIQGTNFRWVVPQLPSEIWNNKDQFKTDLLDKLMASKTAKKGIKYYSIAIESHADGNPHLDMLIIFEKKIPLLPTELDFLCDKHGNLTKYRTLNQAILDYGSKEDTPLSNLSNIDVILNQEQVKKCPVSFLMKQVDRNPFEFDFLEYCNINNYFTTIQRWSYVKSKMRDYQQSTCNLLLKQKPGIQKITKELIQQELSPLEQKEFYSWEGYQQIVEFINQIPTYGFNRPFKTPNLLLVGPPNIGKTSLVLQIMKHTSVYPVGTQNWFPKFRNHTYKLMFWDEWTPDMMSWEAILMLFQGLPMDLPFKGGSVLKRDNQLWIMTHNQTLESHVTKLRRYLGSETIERSKAALRARVTQIIVPKDKPLFLLNKLIRSET